MLIIATKGFVVQWTEGVNANIYFSRTSSSYAQYCEEFKVNIFVIRAFWGPKIKLVVRRLSSFKQFLFSSEPLLGVKKRLI